MNWWAMLASLLTGVIVGALAVYSAKGISHRGSPATMKALSF